MMRGDVVRVDPGSVIVFHGYEGRDRDDLTEIRAEIEQVSGHGEFVMVHVSPAQSIDVWGPADLWDPPGLVRQAVHLLASAEYDQHDCTGRVCPWRNHHGEHAPEPITDLIS